MNDLRKPNNAFNTSENPFFHRGPIRNPAYFFGRQRETRHLLELVRNAQSVSVLGQRRIGKTSFLFHVSNPDILEVHGLNSDRHAFVYIDCEDRGNLSEADLYRLLLAGLLKTIGGTEPGPAMAADDGSPGLSAFEAGIIRGRDLGFQPVFLLDEFEVLATNHHLSPNFFSALRRIAAEYGVAYVTVSNRPLLTLTEAEQTILSSPFFNIFQPLRLGLFTVDEATEMVQSLATGAGLPFPLPYVDCILSLAGEQPLLLQLASFYAFDLLQLQNGNQRSAVDCQVIRERFWVTAVQHFQYYWSHLDDETRYILAALPLIRSPVDETLKILEEQCLIVAREGEYDYVSSTFRDFVRNQRVADIVQADPFLIDRRQQLISYNDQPLELTRTQLKLLMCLLEQPNQAMAYDELEQRVWGDAFSSDSGRLKAAVKHLRRALGNGAIYIANVRGVGYMFQPSPAENAA